MVNVKHRNSILITLFSLTLLMLLFQNCSAGDGLFSGGSLTDPFITDPPMIHASANSNCLLPTYSFKMNSDIYLCIERAGTRPEVCLSNDNQECYRKEKVGTDTGWTYLANGIWRAKLTSSYIGSYTAYVTHTDDISAVGVFEFVISP